MKRTKLTRDYITSFRLGMRALYFETELVQVSVRCGMRYALAVTHLIRRKDRN